MMNDTLSEEQSMDLLRRLFPGGLRTQAVVEALCPEGYAASPLRLAFHPGPEQRYKESAAFHENMKNLRGLRKNKGKGKGAEAEVEPEPEPEEEEEKPMPSYEEFLKELEPDTQKDSDEDELGRLLGLCLWDVLSDNHEILPPEGEQSEGSVWNWTHLGSFRATAGILADFYYQREPVPDVIDFAALSKLNTMTFENYKDFDMSSLGINMDYCEFYMGTSMMSGRTDLGPVYRLIFERLKALGYDWKYSFPRLGVVRFKKPEPAEDPDTPEWANYNPSAAFGEEQKETEEDEEFARMEASLEEGYQESVEDARCRPAPATVQAYRAVHGDWPQGWPPWEG